jgi:hypothetical protein
MCAAIFGQIEAGRSPGAQMGTATKVALAAFVILTDACRWVSHDGEPMKSGWTVLSMNND